MIRITQPSVDGLALAALVERTRRLMAENSASFAALAPAEQDVWLAAAAAEVERLELRTEAALPSLAFVLWFTGLPSAAADPAIEQALTRDGVPEAERLSAGMDLVQRRLGPVRPHP